MYLGTDLKAGSRPKKATKVIKEIVRTPRAIWEMMPILLAADNDDKYIPRWKYIFTYTTFRGVPSSLGGL